jgi:hypothetical protein
MKLVYKICIAFYDNDNSKKMKSPLVEHDNPYEAWTFGYRIAASLAVVLTP